MKKQTNNAASAIEAFRLRLTCSIKSSELLAQFSFLRILGTRSSADCRHRSPKPGGLRRALNWRSFWSAVAGLSGGHRFGVDEHAIRKRNRDQPVSRFISALAHFRAELKWRANSIAPGDPPEPARIIPIPPVSLRPPWFIGPIRPIFSPIFLAPLTPFSYISSTP